MRGSVHRSTCRTEGVSLTEQKRSATMLCDAYTKFSGVKSLFGLFGSIGRIGSIKAGVLYILPHLLRLFGDNAAL